MLGHSVASALAALTVQAGVPIGFGILTCETMEQARGRTDKGVEAAEAAIEMANLRAPACGSAAEMGARRKARELALQMLYEHDVSGTEPQEMFLRSDDLQKAPEGIQDFTRAARLRDAARTATTSTRSSRGRPTTGGSPGCRSSTATSCGWRSSSCCTSRRRRGPVVIDEALEIAKRFSTPKSSQFINGILDGVLKGRRGEALGR